MRSIVGIGLVGWTGCVAPERPAATEVEELLAGAPDGRVVEPHVDALILVGDVPLVQEIGMSYATLLAVLEEGDEGWWVRLPAEGLALLGWLPRAEAPLRVAETAWLGGAGIGIEVPAGTPVDVVDEADGRIQVAADGSWVQLEAWVFPHQIDGAFVPDERREGPGSGHIEGEKRIRRSVPLLDAPDGDVVGFLEPTLVDVIDEVPGYRLIDSGTERRPDWRVRAWVEADAVQERGLMGIGWGSSGCGCGYRSLVQEATVRPGAVVLAGPAGEVIGTVEGFRNPVTWVDQDWGGARVSPSFGDTVVWFDRLDEAG